VRAAAGAGSSAATPAAKITAPLSGKHGFGKFFAVPGASDSTGSLRQWIREEWEKGRCSRRLSAGPLPDAAFTVMKIPGVGEIPVGTFFVLILFFVILVGPLNYLYFHRRKRRPTMVLISIPAAGFGFTFLILAYGLFGEGLGIKGVVYSWSFLNQRTHERVEHVTRTLFAGLAPSYLAPRADTLLAVCPPTGSNRPSAIEMDLEHGGRLSGGIFPSRVHTVLASISVGRARERLRFQKRHGDNGLDILAAPDFRPLEGSRLVVRGFDGQLYAGVAPGPLQPVQKEDERRRARAIMPAGAYWEPLGAREYRGSRYGHRGRYGPPPYYVHEELTTTASKNPAAFGLEDCAPGSYIARMESIPSHDELELSVRFLKKTYLVCGRLAEEDMLDAKEHLRE
jgi:hypothetical protein